MKLTGLDVFDSTIQTSNAWLRELMQELNWSDHRKAYLALRCVLHVLRDNLPVEEAASVGVQLPALLRGVYFESWKPSGKPVLYRTSEEFLTGLGAQLEDSGENRAGAEKIVRAVFRLFDRKAGEGEIGDIQSLLPSGLQDLWPTTLRAA